MMEGIRAETKRAIENYLKSQGLSTMTGQKGHEVQNQRRAITRVTCPICGAPNRSTSIRCRGCDAFIVQKKPTGTAQQQVEYMEEYAENYDAIGKQMGFLPKKRVKTVRRKVQPSD